MSTPIIEPGEHGDVSRDIVVRLVVTKEERTAWQSAADADGRTLSDWMRRRCNGDNTTMPVHVPASVVARRRKKATAKQYAEALKKGGKP